jgi:hypothetical protein
MLGRNQSSALLRVEVDRAAGIEQTNELRARALRSATGDDEGSLCRAQQLRGARDVVRVRRHHPSPGRLQELIEHQIRMKRFAQHVGRYRRTGLKRASFPKRRADRLVRSRSTLS